MMPRYNAPAIVWLVVAAYAAHLLEEYFGGFPEWFAFVAGQPLPRDAFLLINGVALVLIIAAAHAATRHERFGWMAIALGTIVLVNGSAHLLATIAARTYSPGVITGVVLYLPLGLVLLASGWHQATRNDFSRGVLVGLIAHAVVPLVAVALS